MVEDFYEIAHVIVPTAVLVVKWGMMMTVPAIELKKNDKMYFT